MLIPCTFICKVTTVFLSMYLVTNMVKYNTIITDILLQDCKILWFSIIKCCAVFKRLISLSVHSCVTPTGLPGSDYIVSLVPVATWFHQYSPSIVLMQACFRKCWKSTSPHPYPTTHKPLCFVLIYVEFVGTAVQSVLLAHTTQKHPSQQKILALCTTHRHVHMFICTCHRMHSKLTFPQNVSHQVQMTYL